MQEKLKSIYKNKARYYQDVIDMLKQESIHYILINFTIPDNNPGDLDIIISERDYTKIAKILENQSFNYYYHYNTKQFLWNKYLSGEGFIQFHIHLDFYFFGKQLLQIKDLGRLNSLSIELDYIIFLIESFYKNNIEDKHYKYLQYQNYVNNDEICEYVNNKYTNIYFIIKKALDRFSVNKNNHKIKHICEIIKLNGMNAIIYFFLHQLKKIFKRLRMAREDYKIIFIGVDGSGKSTLTKSLEDICSKGGVYPKYIYFGLRTSIIYKIKNLLIKKRLTNKQYNDVNKKQIHKEWINLAYRNIMGIIFWFEYNIRWILQIIFRSVNVQTVWLIDRCYLDVLHFYNTPLVEKLFIEYTFQPDLYVLLTGDPNVFITRNDEYELDELIDQINKYLNIQKMLKGKQIESIIYDSSKLTINELAHSILTLWQGR